MTTAQDLREAIMEGAVQRVRPKMMTVAAIMDGLLPIMWTTDTGADVMKRIAAPDDRRHGQLDHPDTDRHSRALCPLAWLVYDQRSSALTPQYQRFSAISRKTSAFWESTLMKRLEWDRGYVESMVGVINSASARQIQQRRGVTSYLGKTDYDFRLSDRQDHRQTHVVLTVSAITSFGLLFRAAQKGSLTRPQGAGTPRRTLGVR